MGAGRGGEAKEEDEDGADDDDLDDEVRGSRMQDRGSKSLVLLSLLWASCGRATSSTPGPMLQDQHQDT